MVVGTNLMPTGIPSLEDSEDRNFIECKQLNCDAQGCGTAKQCYSSILKQYNYGPASCETASGAVPLQMDRSPSLWTSPPAPVASALSCAASHMSALLCSSETSSAFQLQPGKHSLQSSVKRKSALPEPEFELTSMERRPHPQPLIDLASCKQELQSFAV